MYSMSSVVNSSNSASASHTISFLSLTSSRYAIFFSKASAKEARFSSESEIPQANLCPPYFSNIGDREEIVSNRSIPATPRPEPFHISFSFVITMAGFLNISTSFCATMPRTPTCHFSLKTTIEFFSARESFFNSAMISLTICSSMRCLCLLASSRPFK